MNITEAHNKSLTDLLNLINTDEWDDMSKGDVGIWVLDRMMEHLNG